MRIVDTFLFDGELGLLQHRLKETYDLVDRFVLVEARRTYRNAPKPWVFAEHREEFAWAADKIRWIGLTTLGSTGLSARERAEIQRNSILLELRDLEPEDIVLLLDADEIPSRSFLERLLCESLPERGGRLAMTRHYEFLNVVAPASPCCPHPQAKFPAELGFIEAGEWHRLDQRWYGHSGVAVRYRDLSSADGTGHSPYELRYGNRINAVIPETGRHFIAVDSAARLECKLGRVFHEEYATERGLSIPHLRRCRRYGIHHRGWWYAEIPSGELPSDLQSLAVEHPEMVRAQAMPPRFLRRAMRTWAWVRLWSQWPEGTVSWVERHLRWLMPLLLLPLTLADILRAVWVRAPRRSVA
jgi:beta-1,4-mannosyl-glycoprotein beta-1,4-N-acetylglucosaminyltransferase